MSYKGTHINEARLLRILALVALGFLLVLGFPTHVEAAPPSEPGEPQQAEVQDPSTCAKCHSEQYEAWQSGTHAHAFSTSNFRVTWDETGQPDECLSCHTTGYHKDSGQIGAAGVTCQACHTASGEGHPESAMGVRVSSDVCGECHTSTLVEWQHSQHGQEGVECTACHQSHSQALRVQPEQALCDSCHGSHMQNVALGESADENMTCNNCHMPANPTDDLASHIGGTGAIAHTFGVGSDTCTQCHEDAHGPGRDLIVSKTAPAVTRASNNQESLAIQAARERVRVLESENKTLAREVEKHHTTAILGSAFGFGMGTFAGVIGALILVYVLQRRTGV